MSSRSDVQRLPVLLAVVLAISGGAVAWSNGWRLVALWAVGIALGYTLYSATFRFSAGFRAVLRDGRTAHIRAQLLMIGIAVLLFLPALAADAVLGQPVRGFVFPAGAAVALGAFLFGIGMQLGGGCASGTLYTVGGGSVRMVVTLLFVVTGATIAAFAAEWWSDLPALPPISLLTVFGLLPSLLLSVGLLAAIWVAVARYERRRHGELASIWRGAERRCMRGVWPYALAALALAVLNFVTLILAGRPWGITQAFALWGAKALDDGRLAEPVFWAFWENPTRAEALHRQVWADTTSLMNIAVVVGALLAAGLAGRFAPQWRIPTSHLLGSVIGGLLLGAGAIIATGCNISAMFSGIASGSLHGWLWIAAALPGNWVGIHLRPWFRLDDPAIAEPSVRHSI
ncbi:MAG: YeeE/YedE family protein [Rhodopseudomonas palustris]|uniref:YeeE/YedE family protein n=1 Tax=Rhodopseudomonas palustris TaxID=1076 RepID=A0A933S204_RHOPL|nr:YeeE/YedE family protein [Rhodopseudomonas palustris]